MNGLADTSLFIAREQGRPLGDADVDALFVSVITLGELSMGVMMADDHDQRSKRLSTLAFVQSTFEPLPVDEAAAQAWAALVAALRQLGHRAPINDSWIAAIAISRDLAVVTQDDDYEGMPGLKVARV